MNPWELIFVLAQSHTKCIDFTEAGTIQLWQRVRMDDEYWKTVRETITEIIDKAVEETT